MKINKAVSNSFALIIIFLLIAGVVSSQEYGTKGKSLLDALIPIKHLDINKDDFSDLEFLKDKIGNSRFVFIGEECHGSGTNHRMKGRLVRFLHEEMGFNVLAWESGAISVDYADKRFKTSVNPGYECARAGIFFVWSGILENFDCFEYLKKARRSETPLVNVGFDIQFSGLQDCEFFADDIARFFNQGGKKLIPQNHLDTLKKDLPTLNNTFNITSNLQMCKTLMDIVANMISAHKQNKEHLKKQHSEFESKYYLYKLLSLQRYLNNRYKFPDYDKDYAQSSFDRDHSMAENFRYIADELYPDEKIIVWAHNVHIMRNPDYIEEEEFIYRETMTNDLWQIYGDDIYNIAFVSYQGSVINDDDPAFAQISVCHPTQEGHLSWYLNQPGHEYGFLDIRGLDASHWLKNEKIPARFYAPKSYTANWYDICDAFVFIKTAKPVHIYLSAPDKIAKSPRN